MVRSGACHREVDRRLGDEGAVFLAWIGGSCTENLVISRGQLAYMPAGRVSADTYVPWVIVRLASAWRGAGATSLSFRPASLVSLLHDLPLFFPSPYYFSSFLFVLLLLL
jgi:hypothetical protein